MERLACTTELRELLHMKLVIAMRVDLSQDSLHQLAGLHGLCKGNSSVINRTLWALHTIWVQMKEGSNLIWVYKAISPNPNAPTPTLKHPH